MEHAHKVSMGQNTTSILDDAHLCQSWWNAFIGKNIPNERRVREKTICFSQNYLKEKERHSRRVQ